MTGFMRRHWRGLTLLLAAGLVATWVYWQAHQAMAQADPARARIEGRPIPVRTAPVKADEFEEVIGATAVTTPSSEAVIRAASPSQGASQPDMIIKTVQVREGDKVRAGQVLFDLADEKRVESLQRAEKTLAVAEAEHERLQKVVVSTDRLRKLELATAETVLQVLKEDLKTRTEAVEIFEKLVFKGSVTQLEYYEARSKRNRTNIDVKEAERRLQVATDAMRVGPLQDKESLERAARDLALARIDLDAARRDLAWCKVVSPIDGFIDGRVDIAPGQVAPLATALARVVKLDPIHLRLDFPQEAMESVALGQQAEIVLDSFPRETFQGKVIRIAPAVNPTLRVFPVVVELANPGNRIKAGISGFVRVRLKRQAVVVPAAAVIQQGSKAMVFRVEEGRARIQPVKVLRQTEVGSLEVETGLKHGDQVVVYFSNFYRHWGEVSNRDCVLQDNDLVDVNWKKWTRRD